MDLKKYERTRYQSIYRNKKNKNYVVMISKPVKTSISRIDGKKITTLEEALKIRDNPKTKLVKGAELLYRDDFDTLWCNYIEWCKTIDKQAYNTILRKQKSYTKYFKEKITKRLSKLSKNEMLNFIDKQNCSLKQKNQLIKELKSFFNWCIREEYLLISPLANIKAYKIQKVEMKYWLSKSFIDFIKYLNQKILLEKDKKAKEIAYRTKMFTLITFILGNRAGETRALFYDSFDKEKETVGLFNSIDYNPNSNTYLSTTKTNESQCIMKVTSKLINEIENYKYFLINEMGYNVTGNTLLFYNFETNRPLSDTTLRKNFYQLCEEAGVPKIRMYDLRHSRAVDMISDGCDIYLVKEQLRHKSIKTTADVYGHLPDEIRKEIAKNTDKYY